jgi:2-polyprenyl-3-methyl-5-hydroxy-6-metoxy-1,4-benzoquinol methylase
LSGKCRHRIEGTSDIVSEQEIELVKQGLLEVDMSKEKQKSEQRQRPNTRLVLNPSGKLISRIIPWHVALVIVEPISKLFEPPQRLVGPYVKNGQVVADLGCGRGYYTLALAEGVGSEGKVYAIDLDKKCIRALEKKAEKAGYHNIETHASTAADLSFIKDRSVDFVLANGLL